MAIIEVNHVTKEFKLGQLGSIKLSLQRAIARLNGHRFPDQPNFKALDDVDFKVEDGEVLGIIGSNGAGKSTLLKILSRITVPSKGGVQVRGRVAPLIEVGAGLVGDLTGRENIYLNAAILGMSKKETARKFDEIVAFAELEEFLDTPIKRYSSGMSVRLGFSIATSVDADILIVDEVLAVGDLAFQRKCFDRMENLIKRKNKTVLLVSHNIRQVERLCPRVILLDHGRVLADGKASESCNLFYEQSDETIKNTTEQLAKLAVSRASTGEFELLQVQMFDVSGNDTSRIRYQDEVTISVRFKINVALQKPTLGLGVHTTDFVYLATVNTEDSIVIPDLLPGIYVINCRVNKFPFLPGVYALRLGFAAGEFSSVLFYSENVFFYQVIPRENRRTQAMQEGFVLFPTDWSIRSEDESSKSR